MPIKNYPKGAQKAYRAMVKRYGKKKGKQVFYARANKLGKGKSRTAKIRSTYAKRRRGRKKK